MRTQIERRTTSLEEARKFWAAMELLGFKVTVLLTGTWLCEDGELAFLGDTNEMHFWVDAQAGFLGGAPNVKQPVPQPKKGSRNQKWASTAHGDSRRTCCLGIQI